MDRIAIVGVGCLFPGARTIEELWSLLTENRSAITDYSTEELQAGPSFYYSRNRDAKDKLSNLKSGLVRKFSFDRKKYKLNGDLVDNPDDIYKWTIDVTAQALSDGGYTEDRARLLNTGLVLGVSCFPTESSRDYFMPRYKKMLREGLNPYLQDEKDKFVPHFRKDKTALDTLTFGMPASAIRDSFGMGGPCFSIDAACASTFYAIKLACGYLRSGLTDMMLAGAVCKPAHPYVGIGFDALGLLHQDGDYAPLSRGSNGVINGEGAGMVLLKRLEDAVADKDAIWGVIENIGVSNDGKAKSLLAPDKQGQILAYERAYGEGLSNDVDYIECHATGTKVGDEVELAGIGDFFGANPRPPLIGANKANFGHMLAASGMASLLKVLLGMKHSIIPGTIGIEENLGGESLVRSNREWPDSHGPKRAGINAFGFGGTNAHMVVSEYDRGPVREGGPVAVQKVGITGLGVTIGPYSTVKSLRRRLFGLSGSVAAGESNRNIEGDGEKETSGIFIQNYILDCLTSRFHPNEDSLPLSDHIIMMNIADQALIDAGILRGKDRKVAVIIGMEINKKMNREFMRIEMDAVLEDLFSHSGGSLDAAQKSELSRILKDSFYYSPTANSTQNKIPNLIAGRISSNWGFNGPSFILGALENSAAKAVQLGQLMLSGYEVDQVLVGCISMEGEFENLMVHKNIFGEDTLLPGEGGGAVVLERLEDIRRKGGKCYSVIESVAASLSKGKTEQALKAAGLSPSDIDLLDVSGGTSGFDSLHLKHLSERIYGDHFLRIPMMNTKNLVGNTFAASGIFSIIHACLYLRDHMIPAHDPRSDSDSVRKRCLSWEKKERVRRIDVSQMAVNGICSHLILSEPEIRESGRLEKRNNFGRNLVLVSGENGEELLAGLEFLLRDLGSPLSIEQICEKSWRRTAAERSEAAEALPTLVLIAEDKQALETEVRRALVEIPRSIASGREWLSEKGSYFTPDPLGKKSGVALVYPIGGLDCKNSMDELRLLLPSCAQSLFYSRNLHGEERESVAQKKSETDLLSQEDPFGRSSFLRHAIAVKLHTEILCKYFEIQPDMAFGCSFGEIAIFPTFDLADDSQVSLKEVLEDAIVDRLSDAKEIRKKIQEDLQQDFSWANYLVHGDIPALKERVGEEDLVYLTIICSPEEAFLAGHKQNCEKIIRELKLASFQTPPSIAHTPLANSTVDEFILRLNGLGPVVFRDAPFELVFAKEEDTALSMKERFFLLVKRCLTQPIDFENHIRNIYERGIGIFIDVGPNDLCSRWIKETLSDKKIASLSIDRGGFNAEENVLHILARLVSHNVSMDLECLYAAENTRWTNPEILKTVSLAENSISGSMNADGIGAVFASLPSRAEHGAMRGQDRYGFSAELHQAPKRTAHLQPALRERKISTLLERDSSILEAVEMLQEKYLEVMDHLRALSDSEGGDPQMSQTVAVNEPERWRREEEFPEPEELTSARDRRAILNREQLVEITDGSIAAVLGPDYSDADSYPNRLRMPSPPFLFVSRITHIKGKIGALEACEIETEYDLPDDPWFVVNGVLPQVMVPESSHCIIQLLSYLRIDRKFNYELRYRITDSKLVYHSSYVLKPGDTYTNRVRVNSFLESENKLLVFYDVFVTMGNKLIMSQSSCGGMFAESDLVHSKGILEAKAGLGPYEKSRPPRPLLDCPRKSFGDDDLNRLKQGDSEACFGPEYKNWPGLERLLCSEKMDMLSRVSSVDLDGGKYGCGLIIGEKDIDESHWAFSAHFKNDPILPGAMMINGGVQTLEFYLRYLGWFNRPGKKDGALQHLTDIPRVSTFRGQVQREKTKLRYEIHFKKILSRPDFEVIADIDVYDRHRLCMRLRDWAEKVI